MHKGGLLDGLRVLDLTVWRPGPYATQLLAEIGADVIKIEPPGGDPMRGYPTLFADLNVNKRSIELDLKTESGRQRILELAAETDILVEGFRPGVVARLGAGYDDVVAVNPTIVYCSISGMGQSGPLMFTAGHDLNYQAWAGVLAPEGEAPVVPAIPIADLSAGMAAAFAICAAVIRRLTTGEGERIDVAMTDVLATWTGASPPVADHVDPDQRGVPGYGTFETADGRHLTLGIVNEDHFWTSLCTTLGLSEDAHLGFAERTSRLTELQQKITDAVRTHTRDNLVAELLAADVPVAPVLSRSEMVNLEHFAQRAVVTHEPWSDPATGYPIRFDHHPSARTAPPPALDEHHDATWRARP